MSRYASVHAATMLRCYRQLAAYILLCSLSSPEPTKCEEQCPGNGLLASTATAPNGRPALRSKPDLDSSSLLNHRHARSVEMAAKRKREGPHGAQDSQRGGARKLTRRRLRSRCCNLRNSELVLLSLQASPC
jgi:hypothetical protein